jgi:poly-gamma-glutamate synthase PgsB/CapB
MDFLRLEIHRSAEQLERLSDAYQEFRKAYARVVDEREAGRLLLDYASNFCSSRLQRWADQRALHRWLDDEALQDRYYRERGETLLYLIFLLGRLGIVASKLLPLVHQTDELLNLWDRLGLNGLTELLVSQIPDNRVQQAVLDCLEAACQPVAPQLVVQCISEEIQAHVQRVAMDPSRDVWLQVSALRLMHKTSRGRFEKLLIQRLRNPAAGDDLFVRRACVRMLGQYADLFSVSEATEVWDAVLQDPSDAVREQAASTLWGLPNDLAKSRLQHLARRDPCRQVRARAVLGALAAANMPARSRWALSLVARSLSEEGDPFVLRVAMHVASRWLADRDEVVTAELLMAFQHDVLPPLSRIQTSHAQIPPRRWAAAAREQIWLQTTPAARELAQRLAPLVAKLGPTGSSAVPRKWLHGLDTDLIGRTLAAMAQEDYGLELIESWSGYRIARTPQFGFRWWRAWHEFWRPATDKRQAHRHTTGRLPRGTLRAPSRVMGELSQTKVPGEPLVVAEDGTWRPFLPLPDDVVATLNQSYLVPRPTRIYSSEGVTEIQVSWNPWVRIHAALDLIVRLPKVAEYRNWSSRCTESPQAYLMELQRRGFRVTFHPHERSSQIVSDSSVSQFFPAILAIISPAAWPALWNLLNDYVYYFGSAFENTLDQLVAFASLVLALFLGKHALDSWRIARARRSIPLSIGGWGTRGKSGTERLKAALFNGLGHPILSKTTGCEAMFIVADACGSPLEIPLYRPNDKATIWEHGTLLRFARKLRPSVFLWECMALTPDYVNVLQHQWTQDDLATITNTYPDHEDLQGPSGYDVSQTIAGFVPRNSHLITTEHQMLPLLRRQARRMGTSIEPVGWVESGLLTDDLLNRFPYREHADNVALVMAVARRMGCESDVALKAMADRMVPDLGVLKTHPLARVDHCWIEFTNGMSANERFAALGNWSRLGCDRHDPDQEPGVWLSAVINNRADRVARSRVFADILVNDLAADRYFLIGSNLKGLQGFIWEVWEQHAAQFRLVDSQGRWDADRAMDRLEQHARRFRVPVTAEKLRERVLPMLSASGASVERAQSDRRRVAAADELLEADADARRILKPLGFSDDESQRIGRDVTRMRQTFNEYMQLCQATMEARQPEEIEALESRLRDTLRRWFARKLVVVEAYEATGNEVISQIVDETPCGYTNRVMGMQNIKGTGLDFVYRFHAWDVCERACRLVESVESEPRREGVELLAQMPDYGVLGRARVEQALRHADSANPPFDPSLQVSLETIRLRLAGRGVSASGDEGSSMTSLAWPKWLRPVRSLWLQWFEVSDSVRRRDMADKIYTDLTHYRIGRQRAINELRRLKPKTLH